MTRAALTPAGLQPAPALARRRLLVAVLNLATLAMLLAGVARLLSGDGWSAGDLTILIAFLL
ncbi:MAG: hypothetical protein D6754_17920, partial [Alphaproteobacteria bacterium]